MSEAEIYVVYRNRFNEVKSYTLSLRDETQIHLKAIDLDAGYTKTFRKDRIIQICDSFEIANRRTKIEQKNYVPIMRPEAKTSEEHYSKSYNFHKKIEVCFTGFKKKEKERLNEIATTSSLFVRKSVSKKLGLLVCGNTEGPSKIQSARDMGVPIVHGIDGFLHFLETGEIQE